MSHIHLRMLRISHVDKFALLVFDIGGINVYIILFMEYDREGNCIKSFIIKCTYSMNQVYFLLIFWFQNHKADGTWGLLIRRTALSSPIEGDVDHHITDFTPQFLTSNNLHCICSPLFPY